MIFTPFHRIPHRVFFKRHWPVGILAFMLGFFLVGPLAGSNLFGPPVRESSASFYRSIMRDRASLPEDCRVNQESETERQICTDILERLSLKEFLGSVPVLSALIVMGILYLSFINQYKRGQKAYLIKPQKKGTVTEPPSLPSDLFAWIHCFHVVSLELDLPKPIQLKTYYPWEASPPKPGDTLGIYEEKNWGGALRPIVAQYSPHVAVYGRGQ